MKNILIICVFLFSCFSFSNEVNLEKAETAAETFLIQDLDLVNPTLALVYEKTIFFDDLDEKTIYYVFNINEIEGYIIIAGDDAVTPILGYSLSSYYDGCIDLHESINQSKKIIKITDVLGREIEEKRDVLLLYIYDDGSVERKYMLE
tara:strand:+ start:695 stop:1138 length:444 start_codon:yes stop_codon:yes gene_type:complete